MNRYILTKSVFMILRHWKLHLSFALQIAAGVAVIYAWTTIYHSVSFRFQSMQEEIDRMIWDIIVTTEQTSNRLPLDYNQYVKLREEFPEASFPFCVVQRVYFTKEGHDVNTAYFLFSSDDFIRTILGADQSGFETGSVAYAGDEAIALLEGRYTIIHQNIDFVPSGREQMTLDGNLQLSVAPVETLGTGQTHFNYHDLEDIPLNQVVLLPITSYYPIYKPEDAGLFKLSIKLSPHLDGEEATSTVMEVLSVLLSWNGEDYGYNVKTSLQRFLLQFEEMRTNAAVASTVAGICLVIVMIGLTAVVQMIYIRRKKDMAICSAIGATKSTLFKEFWLESVLPSFSGGVLGTIGCSWYLSAFIHFESFELRQSLSIIVLSVAISLLPGCLAAGSLFFQIRRLQPLEILRRE